MSGIEDDYDDDDDELRLEHKTILQWAPRKSGKLAQKTKSKIGKEKGNKQK